jgi:8-oxo-dGTP diphosphatase
MEYSRIAHAFLGETFTLAQLREVHEAVLGKALDPANFRRMIEASDAVIATDQHLTGARHRPARLYRYNTAVDLADQGPLSWPANQAIPAELPNHPAPRPAKKEEQ